MMLYRFVPLAGILRTIFEYHSIGLDASDSLANSAYVIKPLPSKLAVSVVYLQQGMCPTIKYFKPHPDLCKFKFSIHFSGVPRSAYKSAWLRTIVLSCNTFYFHESTDCHSSRSFDTTVCIDLAKYSLQLEAPNPHACKVLVPVPMYMYTICTIG